MGRVLSIPKPRNVLLLPTLILTTLRSKYGYYSLLREADSEAQRGQMSVKVT